jgi:hypothetical protein
MQSRISAGGNAPDRSVVVGGTLKLLQVAARIWPSIIVFEVILDLTPAAPGVVVKPPRYVEPNILITPKTSSPKRQNLKFSGLSADC